MFRLPWNRNQNINIKYISEQINKQIQKSILVEREVHWMVGWDGSLEDKFGQGLETQGGGLLQMVGTQASLLRIVSTKSVF